MERRLFLRAALSGLAVTAAGCDGVREPLAWLSGRATPRPPGAGPAPTGNPAREAVRVLRRAGYGARPGQLEVVLGKGLRAHLEEQLAPESIPDLEATLLVRRIEPMSLAAPDLFLLRRGEVALALRKAAILRALTSERQLLERVVELWHDHFNVALEKDDVAWLLVPFDRDVVRKHALGKFRDLLRATLESGAMLVSLDGRANVRGAPNENHARELLELHTLGVDGGYDQRDVMELARHLTGFTTDETLRRRGTVGFDARRHDEGPVRLLGARVAGGERADMGALADRLSRHPATARRIARRFSRHFLGEEPEPLVSRAAAAFRASDGDLRATLRTVVLSDEMRSSPPVLARPYAAAMATLRALGASCDGGAGLQAELRALGQLPFDWPTPDGYPGREEAWTPRLLPRFRFAARLAANAIPGVRIDSALLADPARVAAACLARPLTREERGALARAGSLAAAALLAHPEAQAA